MLIPNLQITNIIQQGALLLGVSNLLSLRLSGDNGLIHRHLWILRSLFGDFGGLLLFQTQSSVGLVHSLVILLNNCFDLFKVLRRLVELNLEVSLANILELLLQRLRVIYLVLANSLHRFSTDVAKLIEWHQILLHVLGFLSLLLFRFSTELEIHKLCYAGRHWLRRGHAYRTLRHSLSNLGRFKLSSRRFELLL